MARVDSREGAAGMKQTLSSTYEGWTIQVTPVPLGSLTSRPYLAGRYSWFGTLPPDIPPQFEGHVRCLFKTRREARAAIRGKSGAYYKFRVVRAQVVIREIPR